VRWRGLLHGTAEDPHALILRREGFWEEWRERGKLEWYKGGKFVDEAKYWD
jgi:hypothetical protein